MGVFLYTFRPPGAAGSYVFVEYLCIVRCGWETAPTGSGVTAHGVCLLLCQIALTAVRGGASLKTSPAGNEGKTYKGGKFFTISTVLRLTVMTRAIRSTIYRG